MWIQMEGKFIGLHLFFCGHLITFRIRVFLVCSFDTYHMMFIDIILVETFNHKICIDLKVVSGVFDATNHFICM